MSVPEKLIHFEFSLNESEAQFLMGCINHYQESIDWEISCLKHKQLRDRNFLRSPVVSSFDINCWKNSKAWVSSMKDKVIKGRIEKA